MQNQIFVVLNAFKEVRNGGLISIKFKNLP